MFKQDVLKNKRKRIITLLLEEIILVIFYGIWWIVRISKTCGSRCIKQFIVITVISAMILCVVWSLDGVEKIKYEIKFSCIFLLMLLLYCILLLPLRIPDHEYHFGKAYGVSSIIIDRFGEEDDKYDKKLRKELSWLIYDSEKENYSDKLITIWDGLKFDDGSLKNDQMDFIDNQELNYRIFPYILPAIGISISRMCHASVVGVYYSGIYVNAIFALAMLLLSFRIYPGYKKFLSVLIFIPEVFWLITSYSYDGINLIFSILLVLYCLHCRDQKEQISWKNIVIIGALTLPLIIVKFIYAILILTILLIPKNKIKNRKRLISILLFAGALLLVIGLSLRGGEITGYLNGSQTDTRGLYYAEGNYHFYTISWVALHIPQTLGAMIQTVFKYGSYYILNLFACDIGIDEPQLLIFAMIVVTFVTAKQCLPAMYVSDSDKKKILIIVVAGSLMVVASMMFAFSTYTEDNVNLIGGVQARYFIPFELFLPILFCRKKSGDIREDKGQNLEIMIVLNMIYLMNLFMYFIII